MPKISQATFQARRARIMDAARSCFARRGIHVSVDDICAEAGVSKGAIYGYFPSKEAIIQAIADAHPGDLEHVRAAAAPAELRRLLLAHASNGDPESARLELEAWTYSLNSETIRKRLHANAAHLRGAIADSLTQMQDAGAIALKLDAKEAAALIETFLFGTVAKAALSQDVSTEASQRVAALFDLLFTTPPVMEAPAGGGQSH